MKKWNIIHLFIYWVGHSSEKTYFFYERKFIFNVIDNQFHLLITTTWSLSQCTGDTARPSHFDFSDDLICCKFIVHYEYVNCCSRIVRISLCRLFCNNCFCAKPIRINHSFWSDVFFLASIKLFWWIVNFHKSATDWFKYNTIFQNLFSKSHY